MAKELLGRLVIVKRFPWQYLIPFFLIVGCASPQKAIYLAPSFSSVNIETITLLPIVDSRTQRQFEIDETQLQQVVNPEVETVLNEKGYTVKFSNAFGDIECLKFGHSGNLGSDCLRRVGPKDSRWILVLFLQDFRMRGTYGGAVSTKMSGILFDRPDGLMLWRDLEYAGLSQRELVGENRYTLLENDVIQLCTQKLISSLPGKRSHPEE